MKKHNEIRNVIRRWMVKNFADNPKDLEIDFEVYGLRNIYLYTNYPGIIIGLKGRCIDELREMLKDNGINKKVNVIEIGRFGVHEINVRRKWL